MIRDYAWSPKGAYLAFSMNDANEHPLAPHLERRGRPAAPGHGRASSTRTRRAWDPDGEYLYYLSEREFAPQISQIEWNFAGATA